MSDESTDKYKRIAIVSWSLIGIVILIYVFLHVADILRPVLPPFIYAFIIVYLLRPIVNFFVKLKMPHLLAVIITYIIFILIFALLIFYLLPVVIAQVSSIVSHLPQYYQRTNHIFSLLQNRYHSLTLPRGSDKVLHELTVRSQKYGLFIISSLPETTTGIFGGLFNLVLAPIIAFYLLKDINAVRETFLNLFPRRHREEVLVVARKINNIVGGFLRGQALVSLVVGTTIGLYLWIIGVKFAFLLGLLAGVLNIIPYFGPLVGGAVAVGIALLQSPMLALWVVVGMVIIQQLDGLIISPNILHHTIDLHPAWIIFSLLAGAVLMGFVGLLLAIPVAAVVKALVMYYFYEESELA
ncbi:MAG TPA: AI-2E family transporter [Actinobacteria bacterium]|nr:AI-2E family transporter [Actinomycetes bacterium]HEX21605.1 AI-2E family transporter [Actinomycetota bacterium]